MLKKLMQIVILITFSMRISKLDIETSRDLHLQNISRAFNDPLQISEVVRVICNTKNGKAVNGEINPLPNRL